MDLFLTLVTLITVINSVKRNSYSQICSLSAVIAKSNKTKNKVVAFVDQTLSQKNIDIGNSDLAMRNFFQYSNRHYNASTEDFTES